MKMGSTIVKKGKEYYLIIPQEILRKLNCDTFDMRVDKEKKELVLTPAKSKKGKDASSGKKKKMSKAEEKQLLADLRSGKVGMEDDPEEEAALIAAFERGEFKPISAARKRQLMKDAAATLAAMKKKPLLPMTYKGYLGTYKHDKKANIFHGEVIGIEDVITFQADAEKDMEQAFRDSVDDYLLFLKALKRSNKEREDIPYEKAVKQIKKLRS
ncbi:MAG TPA: hypothetical protein PKH10_02045 [bacterium]|nr:hypothetical protein [bacterium]